jgi:hypothetical protein
LLTQTSIAAGAYATASGKFYGVSGDGSVNGGLHATLWNGVDDTVDLGSGWVTDALGTTFGGWYYGSDARTHAAVWTSPTNRIDLNAGAYNTPWVFGLAPGGIAVGRGSVGISEHALLWRGTSVAPSDLHPAKGYFSSRATAASATQEVGYAQTSVTSGVGVNHAALWNGSAAGTFVDLHPSRFNFSIATGVSLGRQVGIGYTGQAPYPVPHALMWTGSAASTVDVSPAGYLSSEIFRLVGDWAVGDGVDADHHYHALLWDFSTSPATVTDLEPASVAAGVAGAQPQNLSSSGAIAGVLVKVVTAGPPPVKSFAPVAWTPVTRLPGDADLDGAVTFRDFQILERNFGSNDSYWKTADFNDDRVTDLADVAILMKHLNMSAGAATPAEREEVAAFVNSVPEPGLEVSAAVGVMALARRRRSVR